MEVQVNALQAYNGMSNALLVSGVCCFDLCCCLVAAVCQPESLLSWRQPEARVQSVGQLLYGTSLTLLAIRCFHHNSSVSSLHPMHHLRVHLQAWLRQFKDSGRVVTAAEVKAFFTSLQEGRRVRARTDAEEE